MSGRVVPALQFAVNRVGVLTAAAGSVQAVVTRVTGLHAAFSRQITEQTREEHGRQAHAHEARAALRVREGTGPVRTRVARVVLIGAVVEHALHHTHARPVFHQVVGRTQKLSVTGEPRGERPGHRTFHAFTFPTILADVQVGGVDLLHLRLLQRSVRRQKGVRGGLQGFGLSLHGSLRLVVTGRRAHEEASLRANAAVAPGTGGAARADGSAESGRSRVIIIEAHHNHLMSPLPFVGAPRGHARTLGVLVTRADGSDLIQGQNGPRREVHMSDPPSTLTVMIHETRSEPPHDGTTFI